MTGDGNVANVSSRCQKVVDDANAGRLSRDEAVQKLRAEGVTGAILESYLVQLQRIPSNQGSGSSESTQDDRGRTPEGLDDTQREEFRRKRSKILGEGGSTGGGGEGTGQQSREGGVEGLDTLSGMADSGTGKDASTGDANVLAQQLEVFQRLVSVGTGSVSSSTLDSLPHLRDKATTTGDPHIDETLRTKHVYLKEQNFDALVDLLQGRPLLEPLPRSVWKLILKDEYVSFEKLLAGIDPGYDHRDEGKDFGGGYALVKVDHLSARKPVRTESEWNRAFQAWKIGVIQAYPHRKDELNAYESIITNLFRNFAHDPSIPIRADHEVRERYHKGPFHLDDSNRTQAAVMALVHRTSLGSNLKRPLDSSSSSGRANKKPSGAICLNWNGARCDDPCVNGRRHGVCSICGGKHRAFDSSDCKTEYLARRARKVGSGEASAGSSARS
ncbi:hypothetical protein FB446DRAFT_646535 [Lentinula raphanica]|nr:hypothetical protein FB446DRAFT_646535 [Lentinula raphanica]